MLLIGYFFTLIISVFNSLHFIELILLQVLKFNQNVFNKISNMLSSSCVGALQQNLEQIIAIVFLEALFKELVAQMVVTG